MEAVKKAASGAVERVRNSPLFRRKFGTQRANSPLGDGESNIQQELHPERDLTPFVQGVYFNVDYLGKQPVASSHAQEHGCTEEPVRLLWSPAPQNNGSGSGSGSPVARPVSVKLTTTSIRVKELEASSSTSKVLYEFPVFRVSYCGTDHVHPEVVAFVAKDDDGEFNCYVFQCTSAEKAHTLALAIAKAFYLAYQIIQEQQGKFPSPPERELLFEPQRPDDTTSHPKLPTLQGSEGAPSDGAHPGQVAAEGDLMEVASSTDGATAAAVPKLRVTRPSLTSAESDSLVVASSDDDFNRLAKARSNPDILRSTLEASAITSGGRGWNESLQLHTDPGSQVHTPMGSTEHLDEI